MDREQTWQTMKVRGQVRHLDGTILTGKTVRAFDKDLRTEEFLGEQKTDVQGRYEIQYSAEQFSRAEKKSADLNVRAYDDAGLAIASSPILFNAAAEETIDLIVDNETYRGPSEYERLVQDLTPLLQELSFTDLTEDDITFLSGETSQRRERIAYLVRAHRLAQTTGLSPEVFYALFRKDLPTDLPSLILRSRSSLRDALVSALHDRIVPARLRDEIETTIDKLKQLVRSQVLQSTDGAAALPVVQLLGIAGLSGEEQEKALNFLSENEGPDEQVWSQLRSELEDGAGDDLEFAHQMAKLTDNNIPLVKALQDLRTQGTVRSQRDLVTRLDAKAWTELVNSSATEHKQNGDVANYVNGIIEKLRDAFPTTFISAGVARESQIDAPLVTEVLAQNPDLDLSRPSSLDLSSMSVDQQEQVKQSLDSLRREINMFPEFDYRSTLASESDQATIDNPIRKGVVQFLGNEPDFELVNTHLDNYIAAHPTAYNEIPEEQRGPVTRQLKAMQRVSRIAPTYEHLEVLMGEGLDSSHKIAALTRQNFVNRFKDALGGEDQANRYYNKAAQYVATAATIAANLNDLVNGVSPSAVHNGHTVQAIIKKLPNLTTLFGSFDLCDCRHCRSVYGPAAYLVDLLQFINEEAAPEPFIPTSSQPYPEPTVKPLEVLLARRPDLAHIKLSCENTNTPLPYVDLVNEILEFYVEHNGIKPEDGELLARNTDLSADELSANPQYTSDGAYTKLSEAVHSFHLPFNLPVETARIYLEHLGSSRHEVMQVVQNAGNPVNKKPSDFELACEYLKITPEEAAIITGTASQPTREFFGHSKETVVHVHKDDKGTKVSETEDWLTNLSRVPEVLQRCGITYLELVELTKTRFINPGQTEDPLPSDLIVLFSPNSVCDLSKTSIQHRDGKPLTDHELQKVHRFLRLWRKLGWTIQELDKALIAMGAGSISTNVLQQLSHIEKARAELDLPVVALLSLWFEIDTFGEGALYHKLFLNKAVLNPVDPAFALSDSQGQALISDHVPAILAALGINADDLAAIRAATNLSDENASLNLANLTILFRHALLAKRLKLKVKELLVLKQFIDPFGAPAKTLKFIEKLRKIRSSRHTIAQLNYIYRDTSEPAKSLAPTEEQIALLTTQLQDGLKAIADDNMPAPDPAGELTRKKLEQLNWESAAVEEMIGLISGSAIYSASLFELPELFLPASVDAAAPFAYVEPDQLLFLGKMTEGQRSLLLSFSEDSLYQTAVNSLFDLSAENVTNMALVKPLIENLEFFAPGKGKITYDDATKTLQCAGPMSEGEKTILLSLSIKETYTEAINQLFDEPKNFLEDPKVELLGLDPPTLLDQEKTAEEKFAYVLAQVLPYVQDMLSRSFVKQTLSDALELEPAVAALLLETVVQSSTDWLALLDPNAIDAFRQSFLLLNRIALLINGFEMTAGEVAYLSTHGGDFAVVDPAKNESVDFDFNALGESNPPAPTVLFGQWERLFDLFSLRDRLSNGLVDLFSAAAASVENKLSDSVAGILSETTGWDQTKIADLANTFNLKDGDFRNEVKLVKVWECVALGQRLGASMVQLRKWATDKPTPGQAKEIITTVKAKYDEEQWLGVAKPLNNRLRERRKDALIAYILVDPALVEQGITDSNQLFEYFLVDVNMSACFMTSRIKQAVSSVQLFVHRCLLNLEQGVKPSNIDADRWNKWMKYYRVWEANRKVFLYPENWIEPELRDDKSPFFRELETQLLQNEVTDETVENAFVTYLEKLDEVARLEICGLYWQAKEQGDPSDILHVVGRTFNSPHIYYYRKQRVATGVWTPWEKVNLDIDGDHLIPVVYNRRLQLYWPIFEEKPDKEQELPNPQFDVAQPPVMHWEIRLAWSEYRNKKWTPRRVSQAKISTDEFRGPKNGLFNIPNETLKSEYCFRSRIEDGSLLIIPSWAGWLEEVGASFDCPAFRVIGCNGRIQIEPPGGWVQPVPPPDTHNDSMMLTENPGEQDHKLRLNLGVVTGYGKLEPGSITLRAVLRKTPDTFSLVYAHQLSRFVAQAVLFYQDYRRTYLVMPAQQRPYEIPKLKFFTFFHPHVCTLVRILNQSGISVLLSLDAQRLGREGQPFETFFEDIYKPWWVVQLDYPKEFVDFELSGAYSLYNWELFFHTPLLIADRLSKNQRFEEAMKWFHYIFNPTDSLTKEESPQRFWKFLPFHENAHPEDQQIVTLLESLNSGDAELVRQVEEWRNDPFKPHLIARSRITAYQKTVVMKYIDNLIAWGDQLFRMDTIESINEATQLYIMAHNILGPRPEQIPQRLKKVDQTYNELRSKLDEFSNVLVTLENEFPFTGNDAANGDEQDKGLGTADTFYFCIPKNEKLLGYWDTVADRLFKIRHCMNIEGVVRELPLFEPPIDPALLVKAAAMGLDLSSVMNDINSASPHYRFTYTLQKAQQLCGEVKSLGGALLSALEKKDAEELGVLRTSHETSLLEAITEIKKQQVQQAREELEALKKGKLVTEAQRDYYQNLNRISDQEQAHMDSLRTAHTFNQIAQEISGAASSAFGVPQVDAGTSPGGFSGVPMARVTVAFGGSNVGSALQAVASVFNFIAAHHTLDATMASLKGSYDRRWEEWKHHEKIAKKELDQIDKQIAAAEIKLAIAEKELENHQKQVENSAAVEEFLRNKYTNEELYGWMVSQISAVFFQSYKLAYDTAKKAEKAYRYELGLTSSDFIQFGYWDSLRKGLLSGERLSLDLIRLDLAYHDLTKREYELTTHASLLQLDPESLLQLRMLGQCTVSLPEELFDLDCPGHYFRRLKSVSVSIPAVSGPYSSVNCTLTLLKSSIRRSSVPGVKGYARADDDDNRFSDHFGSLESIVTSSGQGDSGLFETNLRDERYLPFEGSGAISEWRLELPNEVRQFNYDTISDVIIHVRYTAREGGSALRKAAVENLKAGIEAAHGVGSVRLFSVRHEFPNDWARFKGATPNPSGFAELSIELREEHYPFWSKGILGIIERVDLYARTEKGGVESTVNGQQLSLLPDPSLNNLKHGKLDNQSLPSTGTLTLTLDDQTVTDLWLALTWSK